MRNHQYKLVLAFFILGMIIILAIGFAFTFIRPDLPYRDFIILGTAAVIYAIGSISIAIFTKKKMIDPMSRMLKGAISTDYGKTKGKSKEEITDIAKSLNKKLKEVNEQKLQTETILKHMTDGVIAFDMKGKITFINHAAIEMLNIVSKDNSFEKIFSKDIYKNLDINMEKIIYLDTWTSSEKQIENNQGTMNLFFVPIKDEDNIPNGLLVVVQDITEHVKLDNMRKRFVSDVSHELQTPLTTIEGFSENLIDDEMDEKTRQHFLNIIHDNAVRMHKLVKDLLILSRYDRKVQKGEAEDFDLGNLAKYCAEQYKVECEKKNIEVNCFTTADVPKVRAIKDDIERVILNIISNSVKYTEEGGKIDIYTGYVHNDAYIKVKDTGIGIPKEDLDKVFERFYRVDKARSREMGGTGLGLSIAHEIMTNANGSIDITSEGINKGTTVTIRLPVAEH